jgi:hypothetical protein
VAGGLRRNRRMEFCAEAVEKWEGSGNASTINNLVMGVKASDFWNWKVLNLVIEDELAIAGHACKAKRGKK